MERRAISVHGVVQGVGFRPFVHGLASRLRLSGFVTNSPAGVVIEVEGDRDALERFEHALTASPPPLARVESVSTHALVSRGDVGFRIDPSRVGERSDVFVCPDVATCDACLAELFDPSNRRYRYPFINCTACGPRLTIVTGTPYDRERTTMAAFEMCEACRSEYEDPRDRRFHAEPIACPVCGPRLMAIDSSGHPVADDPIPVATRALASGGIIAVKGLGGFHLACDAGNSDAIGELRQRKRRDDKPFAIMVESLPAIREICEVGSHEAVLLASAARPVVLLRRLADRGSHVARAVAPENHRLGVMLAYTPLHHLLMRAAGGCPLVMTSGNRSDEPIATDNSEALTRLAGIADLFLVHDRPIHVRCDDSVIGHAGPQPIIVRRSRGYAPAPIRLPFDCDQPILAVGGQLKTTFAIGRGRQAFLSHHIGDLDDFLARQAFERDLALFEQMLDVTPRIVAHDLHPDYASTRLALSHDGVAHIGVQHHHAHVAACLAEHSLVDSVIGVAWDGTGFGTDGHMWGGEFLVGGYADVTRAARFRYVAMPGGDRAIQQPWRMALAHLHDAKCDVAPFAPPDVSPATRLALARMIERGLNSPLTSSVGRLFDAVASIAGVHHATSFEGQAAMRLEALAEDAADDTSYPFAIDETSAPLVVDTRPLVRGVAGDRLAGVAPAAIARRFHTTLTDVIVAVCGRLRDTTGLSRVVLTGGCFLNAILSSDAASRLTRAGFDVYRHRLVPPGDGGICLGQLSVAAARRVLTAQS